jgi:glutathione S-transferase
MNDLTLHEQHISGNCYKIRLTAALLGLKLKLVEYDIRNGETRTPEYRSKINASGKIPTLQIGEDKFLPESGAACYYLAENTHLISDDKFERAQMLRWMFFEQYSHEPAIATMRWWTTYVGLENIKEELKSLVPMKRKQGEEALSIMDDHLATRKFFVGEKLSLADVTLYAYTHVAGEGGFELERWPNVKVWCDRVAGEPNYVSLDR